MVFKIPMPCLGKTTWTQPLASVLFDELCRLLEHPLMDSMRGQPGSLDSHQWRWVQYHQPACLNLSTVRHSLRERENKGRFTHTAVMTCKERALQGWNTKQNIWSLLAETSAASNLYPANSMACLKAAAATFIFCLSSHKNTWKCWAFGTQWSCHAGINNWSQTELVLVM